MATESSKLAPIIATAAKKFATARDIHTVGDLLAFWPRRYRTRESDLGSVTPGEFLVGVAEVKSATTRSMKARKGTMLNVVITDGTHDIDITFFKAWGHEKALVPGARGIFAGVVGTYNNRLQLTHPGYTMLDDFDAGDRKDLIPIYRAVGSLHTWTVTESVRRVLDVLDEVPDPLPADVRAARGLLSRTDALRGIHTPNSWAEVEQARRRLRFEEAFILQVTLAQRRLTASAQSTRARPAQAGGILEAFDARLPFELTAGQREVGETIADEMGREVPMHRLLQGEVGSGKTVVALRAMLAAVDAGGQAALLAPTEVLAGQHHRTITTMLGDLAAGGMLGAADHATRVALLTGSQSAAARRRTLLDVASGDAGIVIGTHALLQENVDFFDLALVVVDEQHRFGVEQRDALRGKGIVPPHVLVMTATPIPRTVAMTVFGDLETSTLRELPAGRAPITTHVVPENRPGWMTRTWARVAEEVRGGRQAYVVCPRIGDDGTGDGSIEGATDGADLRDEVDRSGDDGGAPPPPRPLKSVYAVHAALLEQPVLEGLSIGVLHGRLSAEDKDALMVRFQNGDLDVLVSTTVIEVGVDVANASVMVVMDADRFGVSQLHQLRGRIGRGGHPGLCLLVTGTDAEPAMTRLTAVAATTDGFELARLDLSQRREGDILGAAQHGRRTQLEFLHILQDEDVIVAAREDAFALVADDPDLVAHPDLAAAVRARVDAEQAAYLERG
ncbi:MAG TPA: ATP-dependent DNA helicase RecG [Ornithinibacter sp.]|nr:ATP-dependent DNA helicase RecG [Ornithinibacter sp.]